MARQSKKVIAVHAETGELEQYSSVNDAVTALKKLKFACNQEGVRRSCKNNLKYKQRYWSLVEG